MFSQTCLFDLYSILQQDTLGHYTCWITLSLSGITTCTHRPGGVIIMDIYMSSHIYYYLLLYLSRNRKELCRRIGFETFKRDIFAKLFRL